MELIENKYSWDIIRGKLQRHLTPFLFNPFVKDASGVYNMVRYARRMLYGWGDLPVNGCNLITPARDLPLDKELHGCLYKDHTLSWHVLELYKQYLLLEKENGMPYLAPTGSLNNSALLQYAAIGLYAFMLQKEQDAQRYDTLVLGYAGVVMPMLKDLESALNFLNSLQIVAKEGKPILTKDLPYTFEFYRHLDRQALWDDVLKNKDYYVRSFSVSLPTDVMDFCFDLLQNKTHDRDYDLLTGVANVTRDQQAAILYYIAEAFLRSDNVIVK